MKAEDRSENQPEGLAECQPELVADYQCHIGENPLWHPMERRLYWTDITHGRLFRYEPATGTHELCFNGPMIGGFTVQADGSLLLFMERGAIAVWRDGRCDYLRKETPGEETNRFNDCLADSAGRVFCGTVAIPAGQRPGRLYRLDIDGSLHVLLEGVGISNGMGFTPDRRHLYYTDSQVRTIYLFDYDEKTGTLTKQRVWLQIPEGEGVPDGLTIDAQGYIWSARWDGSALYRYTPEGMEERRINFPARKVSSVTFGGLDYSDMYVTTALTEGPRSVEGQGAGALFSLKPGSGIRGLPDFFSRINIQ